MNGLTRMMNGTINTIHLLKKMNPEAHIRSRVTTAFLNSPRPNTMGNQKTRLMSEVPTSIKSDFHIGRRQK